MPIALPAITTARLVWRLGSKLLHQPPRSRHRMAHQALRYHYHTSNCPNVLDGIAPPKSGADANTHNSLLDALACKHGLAGFFHSFIGEFHAIALPIVRLGYIV